MAIAEPEPDPEPIVLAVPKAGASTLSGSGTAGGYTDVLISKISDLFGGKGGKDDGIKVSKSIRCEFVLRKLISQFHFDLRFHQLQFQNVQSFEKYANVVVVDVA